MPVEPCPMVYRIVHIGSNFAELGMILHQSATAGQCAFGEFRHHEHFIGNIVLGSKSFQTRGHKAEARIIVRMPEYYDDVFAKAAALFQTSPNKPRTDSLILLFRQYCHRRKPHRRETTGIRFDGHRAEEDVSNNLLTHNRNERNIRTSIRSKRVDQISFIALAKSELVNKPDEAVVF
jgi:hypothetical protein